VTTPTNRTKLPDYTIDDVASWAETLEAGRHPASICWTAQTMRDLHRRCGAPTIFNALDVLLERSGWLFSADAVRAAGHMVRPGWRGCTRGRHIQRMANKALRELRSSNSYYSWSSRDVLAALLLLDGFTPATPRGCA